MNKDIEFLYNIIDKKPKKYTSRFAHKEYINKELHLKYDRFLPVTNQNENYTYTNNQFEYVFNYQRYDGNLSYNNFVKNFYKLSDVHSKTIFTSCGMSSIFGVLSAISLSGKYNVIFDKDIYFETQKIINNLNSFKKRYTPIHYLDTISDNFSFNCDFENAIVVIDTTCYSSFCFKQMLEKLLNNNCFCILVRSHTKLDMLGLEYSSLGSIVYILPAKVQNKKFKEYKNIIQTSMEVLSCLGMLAQEKNIFPLLNDSSVIKLNKERIERIQCNNEYFYEAVQSQFELHKHKLFLTTSKLKNYNIDVLKVKLMEFAKRNDDICKFSGSFGFDYIAVDTFMDLIEKKNVIRISIGDVDKKEIDTFVDRIKELLKEL